MSLMEKLNSSESDSYFFSNHLFVEFQDYQAIISIWSGTKGTWFIVFKEKTLGTFSLDEKEDWFEFFKEFAHIFKTIDYPFAKLFMKKKGISNYIGLRKNSIHQ